MPSYVFLNKELSSLCAFLFMRGRGYAVHGDSTPQKTAEMEGLGGKAILPHCYDFFLLYLLMYSL